MAVGAFLPLALAPFLALASLPSAAHDFWILPSAFRVAPNAPLAVHLRVGHALEREPVARDPARIRRFLAAGPDGGETQIAGRAGGTPAGWTRLAAPGYHVIGYRSQRWVSVLEAPKFEAYLKDEGLERILAIRSAGGQSAMPGREWYSRCAKSIVAVAGGREAAYRSGFDRELGMRLELIAQTDPAAFGPAGTFVLKVHFEGKPLAGALIRAVDESRRKTTVLQRSGADGRVRLKLPEGGVWLFTAVHMIEARAEDPWVEGAPATRPEDAADWESFWSSLTVELGPR